MSDKEIVMLEYQYKSLFLLLMNMGLLNGSLDSMMIFAQEEFDKGNFNLCADTLNTVNIHVIGILS